MSEDILTCTRVRACKWSGPKSAIDSVYDSKKSKSWGTTVKTYRCPRCGNHEFYVKKSAAANTGGKEGA